jgi:hypothetical protein
MTKPLTKTQAEYAKARVTTLTDQRINALKAEAAASISVARPPTLTFSDQYALIAAGKAKLRPLGDIGSYTDLNDAYTYPTHEAQEVAYHKAIAARDRKLKPKIDKIRKEAQTVIDKLVMAGADEALAALNAYAEKAEAAVTLDPAVAAAQEQLDD